MKSSRKLPVVEIGILVLMAGVVLALFYPAVSSIIEAGPQSQAKNDVTQIATAVAAFETEYGYFPGAGSGDVGGAMLAALVGSNAALNPRGLVFLEVNIAKKGCSGLSGGVFVNNWGGPYQIAFASGTNAWVLADTNGTKVPKRVAVWSDPNLDPGAASLTEAQRQRRHVDSWH